jgi:hypothetical protein
MVSPLRDVVRRLPVQRMGPALTPLPKGFMQMMLQDPEYKPVPPEACECAVLSKGRSRFDPGVQFRWRQCTLLGQLDGSFPDLHVRMGTGDFLTGGLTVRACRRVR